MSIVSLGRLRELIEKGDFQGAISLIKSYNGNESSLLEAYEHDGGVYAIYGSYGGIRPFSRPMSLQYVLSGIYTLVETGGLVYIRTDKMRSENILFDMDHISNALCLDRDSYSIVSGECRFSKEASFMLKLKYKIGKGGLSKLQEIDS